MAASSHIPNPASDREAPLPKTFAEYFAGIGLVRMGLCAAGWSAVFANDFSSQKYEMYKGFFPDASNHYRVADIFQVDYSQIPTSSLATCSFPCIDLSLAGNMDGIGGKHSSAFWGFVTALQSQKEAAPPLILVENVPGWLSSNRGQDFRTTVSALNDLGYSCDVFLLDALRFTPQSRLRVFLVGIQGRLPGSDPLCILQRSPALSSGRLRAAVVANHDLDWTYVEIPEPPPLLRGGLHGIVEQVPEHMWWPATEVDRHIQMMAEAHRHRVLKLKASATVSFRTFYRRRRSGQMRAEVRDDDMAGCLRTAVGGSSRQFLVAAGKGAIRMRHMTPREYARLQGVPDSFPIGVPTNQAITGFGDAVCVPAIEWIGLNVLNPLLEQISALRAPARLSHVR
jgi:DNA (cytosine-5)-methyltransferase 1